MRIDEDVRRELALRFELLLPHLNERQQRLAAATEARLLGHGGVGAVAAAAGMNAATVRRGVAELDGVEVVPPERVRRAGGGRRPVTRVDPGLVPALMALVEPDERGDPMSPLRWTTKSLRHLADELTRQGHAVSAPTVGKLLRDKGFSLQGTSKTLEGAQDPDRDGQFRYINEQVTLHQREDQPVISVDAKKKEQLGQLPAPGREWRPKGDPVQVEDHSFFAKGPDRPVAIPYGVYDVTMDGGWVNVGTDHDTSAFAVGSIRRWWAARGSSDYPAATRLLITADAGGSNSHRYRLWKAELAAFAADSGLTVTVCHFPPGTSKWNKIEHRLFSQITMNWRGRPLTSHEVVVNTIASTRTRTGLRVGASLDPGSYPVGQAVSRDHFQSLPIRAHEWRGTWNYTISPTAATLPALGTEERAMSRRTVLTALADPRLTGMTAAALAALAARLSPAQAAQTQQRRYEQRGGARRRASGAGARSLLTDADRVLITLLYQRQVCSQKTMSELLGINPNSIGLAIAETRQLLQEHGHEIAPATLRFATPAALRQFTSSDADLPARPQITDLLAHPALTGMPREHLNSLTEQVRPLQAARTEAHRHRARGGERLPGARGGIFPQKITPAGRVLVTVLYRRGIASQEVLADLLAVSRRSIGEAIKQAAPVLAQHGYSPAPGAARFTSAEAVLEFVAAHEQNPTRTT